jgi:molecular chaperone GrpE
MEKENEEVLEGIQNEVPSNEQPDENWEIKYIRLLAEFENYKKRTAKERLDLINTSKLSVMVPILDLKDELSISLGMITGQEGRDSVSIFLEKFSKTIQKLGLEEIQNEVYDSNIHEVISISPIEIEGETNKILDVVQMGYKIGDKIVRYPKVIISK